jgi:hypothetical protein
MQNASDYKEIYPLMGESGAGIGKLLSDVLSQTGYHRAHTNRKEKKYRTSSSGCPICKETICKECWKGGMINIPRKIVRTSTRPNKHAYHIDI